MIGLKGKRRRLLAAGGLVLAVLVLASILLLTHAGYFDRDPHSLVGARGGSPPSVAVVMFSGDLGLRMGLGSYVVRGFADHGVPVLGVSSPSAFGTFRSKPEVERIIASAARSALARTRAKKLVLIGQSFGADVLRVGLVRFPADLRPRIAAAVLVVPGSSAYFRADPSSISYHRKPDEGPETARMIDWLPLICIRGALERDSLCPLMPQPNARTITLPGDHYLAHDPARLIRAIVAALAPVLPTSR